MADKKILLKACNFCAYQERTQAEVRTRLAEWGCMGDEAEHIIAELIQENFLNEERYARTYAGGKFRLKHWGRQKIKFELKKKGLSAYCIDQAMTEISEEDYESTIKSLLLKKLKENSKETNPFIRQKKAADYVQRKGFEVSIIWDLIRNLDVDL